MDTPPIVNAFIAELKVRHEDLMREALARSNGTGLTLVDYTCAGHLVTATFNVHDGEFVQLSAVPLNGPLPGEPAVCYDITPPAGVRW